MRSEVVGPAHFSGLRYAQVWEDADILLEALDIRQDDICLSIASAGDNALALLTRLPQRVIAVDLNPAQIACCELKIAAFRKLNHSEMLELVGSMPSARRPELYRRCRILLSTAAREFWDARPEKIAGGLGAAGKFERYFEFFRQRILPLIHSPRRIAQLLAGGDASARCRFYAEQWDTWRWRLLFKVFFSRRLMGWLGRDPSLFRFVEGDVSARLLERTRHALAELNPAENPYLQWILTGKHESALPCALRAENFATIRDNLHRLELREQSIEDFLAGAGPQAISKFNLSDIFEYMSLNDYACRLQSIVKAARPGARLIYWNMLVPRRRPESMALELRPLEALATRLHAADKAFFYSAFVVEEVI